MTREAHEHVLRIRTIVPWASGGSARAIVVAISLALAGCADGSGDLPGGDAGPVDAGPPRVRAQFDPGPDPMPFGAVPWPDDLYLDAEGRVSVSDIPGSDSARPFLDELAVALGDLDGFGVRTPVYVAFDGAIDEDSLPADADASLADRASAFLLDVDTASPDAFRRVAAEVTLDSGGQRIVLQPVAPLVPGRRYAAVVTRRVRAAGGVEVAPARRFTAVRGATGSIEDPTEREAHDRYSPVFETLAAQGLPHEDVVALAVFRVQTVARDIEDARALVHTRALGRPVLTQAFPAAMLDQVLGVTEASAVGFAPGDGAPHGQVGWMLHGTFEAPGLLSPAARLHGAFERNADGELRVKRTEQAFFTLLLPHVAADATLPVVVFQHGLGAERSDGLAVANALAGAGYAVFLLDLPFHGLHVVRGDIRNRFTGADEPDGFGDLEGDFVGARDRDGELSPLHPFYYRDAVRQGAVQLLTFARLLAEGDWSPLFEAADPVLRSTSLAGDRVAVVGVDLGAAVALVAATVEPAFGALALGFVGAPTLDDWMRSPARGELFEDLVQRIGGDPARLAKGEDPSHWPALAVWQTLVDRADPVAEAATLRGVPVNVLAWIARDDEVVHNHGTETLAAALRAELVGARSRYESALPSVVLAPGRTLSGNVAIADAVVTRVLQAVTPATHDALYAERGVAEYAHPIEAPFDKLSAPVRVTNPTAALLTQLTFFFESWRACVPATPTSVCAAAVRAPD